MVLVWGALADGNQEQNVINISLDTVTLIVLYAPIVSLLTGIQRIPIDRTALLLSEVVFIDFPLVLGSLSKRYLTNMKGAVWFWTVYHPAIGKVALAALLTTLIVLFSLNGSVLIQHPE